MDAFYDVFQRSILVTWSFNTDQQHSPTVEHVRCEVVVQLRPGRKLACWRGVEGEGEGPVFRFSARNAAALPAAELPLAADVTSRVDAALLFVSAPAALGACRRSKFACQLILPPSPPPPLTLAPL